MSIPSEKSSVEVIDRKEHPIQNNISRTSSPETATGQTSPALSQVPDKHKSLTTSSPKEDSGVDSKHTDDKDSSSSNPRKRNAFSELMNPKPKQQKTTPTATTNNAKPTYHKPSFTSGLLSYITQPETFPPGTIIRETEHTILIKDLYPKALVHLLLLPKDPKFYNLTPFEAFNPSDSTHTTFLALMRSEAKSAATLAASELSRLVSPHSKSCQARITALTSDNPPSTLPPTRDFLPDIKIGVHAAPSMDTLHIHIISVDNYSPALKTKKHYNSFNTDFFIDLEEFPLMEGDVNMTVEEQESLIKGDMKCWRCGREFGNKFKQLKEHLEGEYEEWRKI